MTQSWHRQFRRTPKAKRTARDGTVFHSKSEMDRYHDLQMLQLTGHIRGLKRQVAFPLQYKAACGCVPSGMTVLTPSGKVASYVADFVYEVPSVVNTKPGAVNRVSSITEDGECWQEVIEDHKGFYDKASEFKIAVFEAVTGNKVTLTGERKRVR